MPITAPLKLPNSFVHLTLDAMHAAILYGKGSSSRIPQRVWSTTQFGGVSTSMKMTEWRLFRACERGDIDTVRRIVGTDPNSVRLRRGLLNTTPLHEACL